MAVTQSQIDALRRLPPSVVPGILPASTTIRNLEEQLAAQTPSTGIPPGALGPPGGPPAPLVTPAGAPSVLTDAISGVPSPTISLQDLFGVSAASSTLGTAFNRPQRLRAPGSLTELFKSLGLLR